MEEKYIQIEDNGENKNKIIKNKNQNTPKTKQALSNYNKFSYEKRKANNINLTTPNKRNTIKIIFDEIPSFHSLSLYDKNKTLLEKYSDYEILEMNEKDKMLLTCFNYLRKNTVLEDQKELNLNNLNKKIRLNIIQREPNLFIIIIDNERFTFDEFSREMFFVNEETKKNHKKIYIQHKMFDKFLEGIRI